MGQSWATLNYRDGRVPGARMVSAQRVERRLAAILAADVVSEPGGICVSGTVRDHIGDRLDLAFDDLGEQTLKNIVRPSGFTASDRQARPLTFPRKRGREARAARGWGLPSRRCSCFPTSRRSQSCRSRTCRATLSRNILPTAWSRRSSPRLVASAGCSSSRVIRASPIKARRSM